MATSEKTFYFVDGIAADRASKKLMRRHVMKGKNAGKTFHRPSRVAVEKARRPAALERPGALPHQGFDQEGRYAYWMRLSERREIRSIENVILPFSLPVEVTPKSLMVINQCKQGLKMSARSYTDTSMRSLWPGCGSNISSLPENIAARDETHVDTRPVLGR